MAVEPAAPVVDRACALASRAAGEQPVGWAIAAQRFVLVEVPLPWPAMIEAAAAMPPGLADVLDRIGGDDSAPGFEALVPDPEYSVPDRTRVILLDRAGDGRAGYRRAEYRLPAGEIADLVDAWGHGMAIDSDAMVPAASRDIVVCTHGSHDPCCGRFGASIYQALRHTYARTGIRVWRGSHTGGHRFSPTLIDLPDGRSWGRLVPEDLSSIVQRTGDPSDLRERYRGLGSLPTYYERLAEAELLFRHGWTWLGRDVTGEVVVGTPFAYPEDQDELDDYAVVRISATIPDPAGIGRQTTWEARIERGPDTPTRGECGEEAWVAPSYAVVRLEQVDP